MNATVEHRRDNIRIVDLPAGDAVGKKDFDQSFEDARPFAAMRNCVRNRCTSLIAVAIGNPGAVACGRVTAARYSRRTWGLIHGVAPAAPSRARAAAATE
jgi:hypothetical protein